MTAPARTATQGLLGTLMAAVRSRIPQRCTGIRCRRSGVRRRRLPGDWLRAYCPRARVVSGPSERWDELGRPDLDEFVAHDRSAAGGGSSRTSGAAVAGCGYGSARGGMCQLHAQRWERAGRPDRDAWMAGSADGQATRSRGDLPHPALPALAARVVPFCHSHNNTWKVNGRPDVDEFADRIRP